MDIRLPPLAEGVESATVVSILVKEGDTVQKGQVLIELETAKAVGSVPSPSDGRVSRVLVKEGQEIKIGQVVASLSGDGAQAAAAPASAGATGAAPSAPARPEKVQEKRREEPAGRSRELEGAGIANPTGAPHKAPAGIPVAAAPSLRKAAAELGIDLTKVHGTGPGGRISVEDVRAYIADLQHRAETPAPSTNGSHATAAPSTPHTPLPDFSKWGSVRREKVSTLRKTIAERMVESWTTVPHVTQHYEADITAIMALRKKIAPAFEKKGARITLTSFMVRFLAELLKKHPVFNCTYDMAAREIVYKDYVNIGIAVETEAGLMVPVLRNADQKDLVQISKDIQELAEKARTRKLGLDEMQGGTFTISNQGAIGGAHFTPIINLPEVAIIGMGQGMQLLKLVNGKPEPRMILPLSLSHDHRVIDGAAAARFIKELADKFETFKEEQLGVKA